MSTPLRLLLLTGLLVWIGACTLMERDPAAQPPTPTAAVSSVTATPTPQAVGVRQNPAGNRLSFELFVPLVQEEPLGLAALPNPRVTPLATSLPSQTPLPSPTPTPTGPPVMPTSQRSLPFGPLVPPRTPTPLPTDVVPTSLPTRVPATPMPVVPQDFLYRDQWGVQVHLHNEDIGAILGHLETLGAGWVKVQVSWKLFQPGPERYDEVWFRELDELIAAANDRGIQVMLGVAKAPEWSRETTELDGPPRNNQAFTDFMFLLGSRYVGKVAAYELWNEPNLVREWNGAALDGKLVVDLVAAGARGLRLAEPEAFILGPAPVPTGINDGVTAVDDRTFFRQMIAAGLPDAVDGFGIHPYGWANPPASRFERPAAGVGSHNDHPSFFFQDTLLDYREILLEFGVNPDRQQLWPTEFGWGTTDGLGLEPRPGDEYMVFTDQAEQATYTVDALLWGQQQPWIGPLVLWNLNFAPTFGPTFSESSYSILSDQNRPRPVYSALQAVPKR